MDLNQLIQLGAKMIQDNSDPATSGIDLDNIGDALSSLLGGNGDLDIAGLVQKAMNGGLADVVQSWIGQGENAPISPDQVTDLFDSDQIAAFAEKLGVGEESAKQAIADALPQVVDQATPAGSDMVAQLLDQVGGVKGAMNMLGKLFD
ncbi:MAG: DUF937 domain-containing protein [Epsilonproteobacteria bacterium]|nr:DUF937 domain-containing protein [Campylobacterota bacterium]